MEVEILDRRIKKILAEDDYNHFHDKVQTQYHNLCARLDNQSQQDLSELLFTLREVETLLTDNYFKWYREPRESRCASFQGSMATLA